MKIIKLEVENVKRIKAATIKPDGSTVVIGGKNGAGKSSAIDSIAYALGGKALCPDEPLRRGKKRGSVKIDLGEYSVERIFTKGGSRLEVKGSKDETGQALLDRLIGKTQLGFDPIAFMHKKRADQLEVVKQLAGVDCADLEKKRQRAYDDRTDVNRTVKSLAARVDGMPHHKDAPDKEVSMSDLLAELDKRRDTNERNDDERDRLEAHNEGTTFLINKINAVEEEIDRLEVKRKDAHEQLKDLRATVEKQQAVVDELKDQDENEVRQQIDASEEVNRRVRENNTRAALATELEEAEDQSSALTDEIESCDDERKKRIEAAKLPVEGMGFDDDCVTFNGLPLDQASQAEQIRVVVAIAFALSGELRIALVRGGSLLDDDSLALLRQAVDEDGGQLWIEHARAGSDATVVFEDGELADKPLPF